MAVFIEAIEQAQSTDRHSVRDWAARQFDTDRIVDSVINAAKNALSAAVSSEKIHCCVLGKISSSSYQT
jgi:hypothetical protein